jgi:hypothetical protein
LHRLGLEATLVIPIPALQSLTQEVRSQPRQTVCKTLSGKYPSLNK